MKFKKQEQLKIWDKIQLTELESEWIDEQIKEATALKLTIKSLSTEIMRIEQGLWERISEWKPETKCCKLQYKHKEKAIQVTSLKSEED